MRRPIVAGNWKMHGSNVFVRELLLGLKEEAAAISHADIIVFPPFVFLAEAQQLLSGSSIHWGAQNVYPANEGAFTGEISPSMLKEFGCQYVIVGHSERRHVLGETNEQVVEKFLFAGEAELTPIICVGETKQQREQGQTFEIIAAQLTGILTSMTGLEILENAIIAYEPVWAIGTGLTASPAQAQEVHEFIRNTVKKTNKLLAEKCRILYGGSLKESNAAALFAMPDIDGGLIGGASLHKHEFLEIARLCN